ncbi:putative 6-phospho-beta-glucosidase [Peptococcaceae bacterium CEB3]|nr:putative 6-phospho-beta-glucosidase [Peptococcaceae bacterium CEB3]
MRNLKLVVIGGGSSYTPELAEGLIKKHASLPIKEIVLADIGDGREKAGINGDLLKRMYRKAGLDVNVWVTLDRREALAGADFVVTQFRVGGLEARAKDESIPMKYDLIGQETTGPGGFAKALRTIPVILEMCRDIEELCPNAWLINFTNPSGIVTEAIHTHSQVKCIGLCNVPINMERAVMRQLGVDSTRLHCRFTGLNHLSFITAIYLDGRNIIKQILDSPAVKDEVVKNIPNVDWAGGLLDALGVIPSPYLRYFYFEKQMLAQEKENVRQGLGTRANEVMEIEKNLFALYKREDLDVKPEELDKRGGALYSEAAVSLMDSIWNNRSELHVVNTLNRGSITDLPAHSVIETNCMVNAEGAFPLANGPLPIQVRGLVQQVKAYEELTVAAAVTGDRSKALMALLNNPLVHDVETAQRLLNDLLEGHRQHLPLFFPEEGEG